MQTKEILLKSFRTNILKMPPKRAPKGIFGLPSKNMLFSFTPRNGEEWPNEEEDDDDDDSDYEPGHSLKPMVEDIPRSSDSDWSETEQDERHSAKRKRKSDSTQSDKRTKRDKQGKSKSSHKQKDKVKRKDPAELRSKRESRAGTSRRKSGQQRIVGGDVAGNSNEDGNWGQRLPLVALERILFFAVSEAGVVPLLCRVSRVCRLWREAGRSSTLWHHAALDNGRVKATDKALEWLTANRFPPQLTTINLNSWAKLTDKSFVGLLESCPNIKNISLQKCVKLTSRSVYAIRDNCPCLTQLDLGLTGSSLASSPSVRDLLKERGTSLRQLHLSGCSIVSSAHLMSSIKSFCANLRLLDLSNCHVTVDCVMLPVEEMQKGCPLLEILRLAGTRIQASNASAKAKYEAPGFTKLQELSLAVADNVARQIALPANMGVPDDFLRRVLKSSPDLKMLDLRGCALIMLKTVQELTVTDLEQLYISRCSLCRHEGVDVVVSKWRHSLVDLDLSWNTYPDSPLTAALRKLSSSSQLRTLDLDGTNVSQRSVESILNGCPKLESLKLTSCRSLPRGTKRWYEGKALKRLRKELLGSRDDDDDDDDT